MGKKRFIIGGLAAGVVALAVMPAVADTGTFTGPGLIAQCAGTPLVATGEPDVDSQTSSITSPADFGAGGSCFTVAAGATGVNVTVTDDSGAAVPFNVQFQAPDGFSNSATSGSGCGNADFTFPTDITTGYVYVFADQTGGECADSPVSTATSGTIDAAWDFPPPAA